MQNFASLLLYVTTLRYFAILLTGLRYSVHYTSFGYMLSVATLNDFVWTCRISVVRPSNLQFPVQCAILVRLRSTRTALLFAKLVPTTPHFFESLCIATSFAFWATLYCFEPLCATSSLHYLVLRRISYCYSMQCRASLLLFAILNDNLYKLARSTNTHTHSFFPSKAPEPSLYLPFAPWGAACAFGG